ncbi:MAG: DUF1211 domain-containing protein [Thermoplasmata archaeon]|nr:DUF1211 domain-containing protein [Thermoplasmata archaeon]
MEADETPIRSDRLEAPWVFRGQDMSRILALSDGIFAFAMTLLVLGLVLPTGDTGTKLQTYIVDGNLDGPLFAYVFTFFVIAMWWQGHHLIFTYIRRFDRPLVRLNSIFLIFMAILPFATIVLNSANGTPVGDVFFAGIQIAAGTSLGGLWWYASGPGALVGPNFPPAWRTYLNRHMVATPVVFAVSIPVALVSPGYAEFVWLGVFVISAFYRKRASS